MSAERELHDLHNGLEEVIGPERAATLMSRLPAVPLSELVTKADLHGEMSAMEERLSGRMEGEFKAVRLEMAAMGDRLRAEFTAQLSQQFSRQTWTIVVAFVMAAAAIAGLT